MRRVLLLPLFLLLAACTFSGGAVRHSTPPATSRSVVPSSTPAPPSTTASRPAASTSTRRSSSAHRTTAHRSSTPPAPPTGITVVLNPGHNGGNATHTAEINRQVPAGYGRYKACDTTGTNTDAGYPEHAFNWDVAVRVRAILEARGIRVIMTRPNDTGVGPCVDERAAIGNHSYVAAVVSIHADGAPSAGHGFHVNQDSQIPDGATALVAHESDELGQAIHAALVRSSGLVPSTYIGTDGYYYRTNLAGLDLATRPATFLELGNMRNAGDAALQSSPSGRARIAAAVAAGILAYLHR
ncbi:MAG TPA: N-acetylmuramoyl-L-alanine amidase [Jatrophihabitans sp.]|nr:N-acetylmuramoyl-L-alanine amidase [Jatrophihabitans sp.]